MASTKEIHQTKDESLLASNSRIVAYMPNLHAAVRHFRAFSSYDETKLKNRHIIVQRAVDPLEQDDCHLGILAPKDGRFPLPGMQGPARFPEMQSRPTRPALPQTDILTEPLPVERQVGTLGQYMIASRHMTDDRPADNLLEEPRPSSLSNLECVALRCPDLLKKEFSDLFPDRNLNDIDLTVITISQKTQHDMSGWSPVVEEEREQLLEQFVNGAQDICAALKEVGYWADFIEPSSGRPFFGAYSNATLFETDERYRELGFDIEDLGCCRVIHHHIWGNHAYIGCLFTDAPNNHPIITDMIDNPEYQ